MKIPKLYTLVLVKWVDADAGDHHWVPVEQVHGKLTPCKTAGWLIKVTAKTIVVASSCTDDGLVVDTCTIPKNCIKLIKTFKG